MLCVVVLFLSEEVFYFSWVFLLRWYLHKLGKLPTSKLCLGVCWGLVMFSEIVTGEAGSLLRVLSLVDKIDSKGNQRRFNGIWEKKTNGLWASYESRHLQRGGGTWRKTESCIFWVINWGSSRQALQPWRRGEGLRMLSESLLGNCLCTSMRMWVWIPGAQGQNGYDVCMHSPAEGRDRRIVGCQSTQFCTDPLWREQGPIVMAHSNRTCWRR